MKRNSYLILTALLLGILGLTACSQPALVSSPGAGSSAGNPSGGADVEFVGLVSAIAPDQWVIADQAVAITAQTVIDGTFAVGDTVKARVHVDDAGQVFGVRIEASAGQGADDASSTQAADDSSQDTSEFVGVVESIGADAWTVSGQVFLVTPQTEIKDDPQVGDTVKVHAFTPAGGALTATEIELATGAASSGDDNSSADDSAGSEMEFTGTVESMAPGLWTVSGLQFAITGQTEIKNLIAFGDAVKVHALVGSDGSLTAREIELAGADDQANLGQAEITGTLDSVLADGWVVGGRQVLRTSTTEVKGDLKIGDLVKVEGIANPDGTFTAREISKVTTTTGDDSGSGSGNSGSGSGGHGADDGSGGSGSDDGSGHDSGDDSGGGGGHDGDD